MKLGDLDGKIAINYLIFNGSGGALPPFSIMTKHTLSAPITRLNSEKLVITPKMRCDCGGKGLVACVRETRGSGNASQEARGPAPPLDRKPSGSHFGTPSI